MKTMLRYDFTYLWKTFKFVVMGGLGFFLAGLSVLTARFMPEIFRLAFADSDIIIDLPDPTVMDAYEQFFSNFTDLFVIVVIFLMVAFFTRDETAGHAPLIFSKPLRRRNYILTKSLWMVVTVFATLLMSGLVFMYYTAFLFDGLDMARFMLSLFALGVFIIFLLHIALFFTVWTKTYLAPVGLTFLVFLLVFSLLNMLQRGVFRFFPNQLMRYPLRYLQGEVSGGVLWATIAIAIGLSAGLLLATIAKFEEKELA